MRKCFAIFSLFVLLCPYMGTKAILLHRKSEIKEEVKRHIMDGVDQSELVQLSFLRATAKTELEWEHSREFEYRGEMYDVVQSEEKGDSITYWCIHDRAETAIKQQLDKLAAQATGNDQQHQSSLSKLFHFLKALFFEQSPASESIAIRANARPELSMLQFCTTQPTIFSPPPEA